MAMEKVEVWPCRKERSRRWRGKATSWGYAKSKESTKPNSSPTSAPATTNSPACSRARVRIRGGMAGWEGELPGAAGPAAGGKLRRPTEHYSSKHKIAERSRANSYNYARESNQKRS
ncbi:hypothetical protein ABZP36_032423 [Zizania latifolia]